jgi:hypothetical protein
VEHEGEALTDVVEIFDADTMPTQGGSVIPTPEWPNLSIDIHG